MSLWVGMALMMVAQGPVEQPVEFKGAGGITLYGTLTMPAGTATLESAAAPGHVADKEKVLKVKTGISVPGVLLLPGSGPTDRDGNQPPALITDVLKQISNGLAEKGIATLRFDKRATRAYLSQFPKDQSKWAEFFKWENFVDDATAAYRFLGAQPGVDGKRVAIIGHSEGAEIALQIGSNLVGQSNPPAALVTIGGAGRPMGPILTEQIGRALERQKALPPVKKIYMDGLQKAIDQTIKTGTYPDDVPAGLKVLFNPTTTMLMRSYLTIDPSQLASHYSGPVLLINGAHDTQVSPDRDTPKLKDALAARSAGTVEMLIVPDASHNLKSTSGGNDDAFTGPVAPLALTKIVQFLIKELHA